MGLWGDPHVNVQLYMLLMLIHAMKFSEDLHLDNIVDVRENIVRDIQTAAEKSKSLAKDLQEQLREVGSDDDISSTFHTDNKITDDPSEELSNITDGLQTLLQQLEQF